MGLNKSIVEDANLNWFGGLSVDVGAEETGAVA